MKFKQVPSENGHYLFSLPEDLNFINPISFFSEGSIKLNTLLYKEALLAKKLAISESSAINFARQAAIEDWNKQLIEIRNAPMPSWFASVLNSSKKRDQIKLLKNKRINAKELLPMIINAYLDLGYTFSRFIREHLHRGAEKNNLPEVIHLKNNLIKKVGETTLTDGQLKQIMEQRHVIVVNFFDKGNTWHCFFITYKSIGGKENWNGGQPHYHYISDKFGISRGSVVESLKSKFYNLGNLPHIALDGYRDKD